MTGRAKQKSKPTCESARCNKVLYSPIRCDVRPLLCQSLPNTTNGTHSEMPQTILSFAPLPE